MRSANLRKLHYLNAIVSFDVHALRSILIVCTLQGTSFLASANLSLCRLNFNFKSFPTFKWRLTPNPSGLQGDAKSVLHNLMIQNLRQKLSPTSTSTESPQWTPSTTSTTFTTPTTQSAQWAPSAPSLAGITVPLQRLNEPQAGITVPLQRLDESDEVVGSGKL